MVNYLDTPLTSRFNYLEVVLVSTFLQLDTTVSQLNKVCFYKNHDLYESCHISKNTANAVDPISLKSSTIINQFIWSSRKFLTPFWILIYLDLMLTDETSRNLICFNQQSRIPFPHQFSIILSQDGFSLLPKECVTDKFCHSMNIRHWMRATHNVYHFVSIH